jgi:hypothetical protein
MYIRFKREWSSKRSAMRHNRFTLALHTFDPAIARARIASPSTAIIVILILEISRETI